MHIEITPESLLIQLRYTPSDTLLQQMQEIINATDGFETFSKHILTLNDELRHLNAFVAMSNSNKHLKIKSDSKNTDEISSFTKTITKWADKYKVTLEKVEGKNTYYIISRN